MPAADTVAADKVKDVARLAQRAQARVADKTLKLSEFNFAHAMFGNGALEAKLQKLGYVGASDVLPKLAEQYAMLLVEMYSEYARVDDVAADVLAQIAKNRKAGRGGIATMAPKALSPEQRAKRDRIDARNDAAAARAISVHLNGRALYEGLSLALMELVRRAAAGEVEPELAPGKVYMRAKRTQGLDDMIERAKRV